MPEKVALTTKAAVDALPYSRKGQGQAIHYCTELTGFGVRAGAREKTFVLWRAGERQTQAHQTGPGW